MKRSFITAVLPIIIISTLFGMLPFSITSKGVLQRTPLRMGCSALLVAGYITFAVTRTWSHNPDSPTGDLGDALECIITLFSFVPLIITPIFHATVKFSDWNILFQNLIVIENEIVPSFKKLNCARQTCVIQQVIFAVTFHTLESVSAVYAWWKYWYVYPWCVQQILHSVVLMQILNTMLIIRDRRRKINEELLQFGIVESRKMMSVSGRSWAWHYEEDRMEKLRQAHLLLSDAHDAANRIFSLIALLEMGFIWAQTMMHIYSMLLKDSKYGGEGLEVVAGHTLNVLRSALSVTAVSHCCASSTSEAHRTRRVVARMKANHCQPKGLDDLSLQLDAVEPEFRAMDFFSIDMPFLFSFFSSMFGILVILVQFDGSGNEGAKNVTAAV